MPSIFAGKIASNPETDRVDEVNAALREAAYLPMVTIPDPRRPNQPIFDLNGHMVGVRVHEQPHRLNIWPAEPTLQRGLRAANVAGESVASVSIRWLVCPDDFDAAPGREPPPTALNPYRSQRFVMLDGLFRFTDSQSSSFTAFGHGRTYPQIVNGQPRLALCAVISTIAGTGQMEGLTATNVVTGFIRPPGDLLLHFSWRVLDPYRRLRWDGDLNPPAPTPEPAPDVTVIALLGETDKTKPVTLILGPGGMPTGSNVFEQLRLVKLAYDVTAEWGVRAKLELGPVVAALTGRLHFNPMDPRPETPIATSGGVFSFFGSDRAFLGSVFADVADGRAFRTFLPGVGSPIFRFGGSGLFSGGTGLFRGATGLMSLNAVVSIFPRTLSNLYLFRFNDPDGRFRSCVHDAWF